jgi:hypothetical protein
MDLWRLYGNVAMVFVNQRRTRKHHEHSISATSTNPRLTALGNAGLGRVGLTSNSSTSLERGTTLGDEMYPENVYKR